MSCGLAKDDEENPIDTLSHDKFLSALANTYEGNKEFAVSEGTRTMTESREKLLIDIRELSALTGIAVGTLYHWASSSEARLPCVRLGARCLRFSVPAIREWIAEQGVPASSEKRNTGAQRCQLRRKT